MEALEARIRRRVQLVVVVIAMAIGLALTCQADVLLSKGSYVPNPVTLLPGLVLGLLSGLLINKVVLRRALRQPSLRVVSPFWIGILVFPVLFSGLVFWVRADDPMDWRPVIAAGLVATLPGGLLGWLVAIFASRSIRHNEPSAVVSQAAIRLTEDLKQTRQNFPGADGQIHKTDETYLAYVKVPRQRETVIFYIECAESYPQDPPLSIGIEVEVEQANGHTEQINYSAPIQGFWHSKYTLSDVINEALYITKH